MQQQSIKPGEDFSFCASEKRVSQWEELMRKFSKQHEEECKAVTLDIPRAYRSTKYFPTGSHYTGTWDVLGMSGYGVYIFPNGVIYEGEFEDGMFHGKGKLRYQDECTLKGHFDKGVMMDRTLTFDDGLVYEEQDWQYCKMPDRRFTIEYKHGLQPAGRSNMTAKLPSRKIPPSFYDTGDGFYDPATKCVYKADDLSAILRSPSIREQKWIIENCRSSEDSIVGPRPDFYEKWSEPQLKLPPVQQPAATIKKLYKSSRPTPTYYQDNIYQDKSFFSKLGYDITTSAESQDKESLQYTESNESQPNALDSKLSPQISQDIKSDVKSASSGRPSCIKTSKILKNIDIDKYWSNHYDFAFRSSKAMHATFKNSHMDLESFEQPHGLKSENSANFNIGITSSVLTFKNVEHGVNRSSKTKIV